MQTMIRKRALLISSTYGGLQGPPNDVQNMARALVQFGFQIDRCCGSQATRDGIKRAWEGLNAKLLPGDAAVIYYSGHGGVVECRTALRRDAQWRYQFLIPVDFQANSNDFRGITDREVSFLLKQTTDRTTNTTVIFDCCFAGRMARDPSHGDKAARKGISNVEFEDIEAHHINLERTSNFQLLDSFTENPNAVRIAAGGPKDTAWEYENSQGLWCGIMTEALVYVLNETVRVGKGMPWRSIIPRVLERVHIEFPLQHPRVEGFGDRHPFSSSVSTTDEFPVTNDGNRLIIEAGWVSGVHYGGWYKLKHLGSPIADVWVTDSEAFKSQVELASSSSPSTTIPKLGLTAILWEDSWNKWPVSVDPNIPGLEARVRASRFIRPSERGDSSILAHIRVEGHYFSLYTRYGMAVCKIQATPGTDTTRLVRIAEQLGRARHLYTLSPKEPLQHDVTVQVRNEHLNTMFRQDGTDNLAHKNIINIHLHNNGGEYVYAWTFLINGLGDIQSLRSTVTDLPPGRPDTIRRLQADWPRDLGHGYLEEWIVVILTNRNVDLSHLTKPVGTPPQGRSGQSTLERLIWQLAGGSRTLICLDDDDKTYFATIIVPYTLRP